MRYHHTEFVLMSKQNEIQDFRQNNSRAKKVVIMNMGNSKALDFYTFLKTDVKINDAVIPSPTRYNLKNPESENVYKFQIQLGEIISSEYFCLKFGT